MTKTRLLAWLAALYLLAGPAWGAPDERGSLRVSVDGETVPFHVFSLFPMPAAELHIHAAAGPQAGDGVAISVSAGRLTATAPGRWVWQAPADQGLARIALVHAASGDRVDLNVFVKTPARHDQTSLKGYRIGRYQPEALRGNPVYARPDGFVEVTEANRQTRVSPHFTLEQFLCKQADGPPRFLLVAPRLLIKLEATLAALHAQGIAADTLFVMSGFRTPWYNRSIGNTTVYSRHLYGDAADIFVDQDNDGLMDDLDGDGVVSRDDAAYLARLVEQAVAAHEGVPLTGGLGIYGPASHRGPFVHVDVRGYRARW